MIGGYIHETRSLEQNSNFRRIGPILIKYKVALSQTENTRLLVICGPWITKFQTTISSYTIVLLFLLLLCCDKSICKLMGRDYERHHINYWVSIQHASICSQPSVQIFHHVMSNRYFPVTRKTGKVEGKICIYAYLFFILGIIVCLGYFRRKMNSNKQQMTYHSHQHQIFVLLRDYYNLRITKLPFLLL